MRMRAGLVATAMLMGLCAGLAGLSGSAAAPLQGAASAAVNLSSVPEVRYVRRHGRSCYRKCYREFVIGRRVCRTYCSPF